jgi:hypothetical protein
MALASFLEGKGLDEVPPDMSTAIMMAAFGWKIEYAEGISEKKFRKYWPMAQMLYRAMMPRPLL